MLLQDVRDNKTEAANAAPQALRLCQMVGSTASNFHTDMHCGFEINSSSQTHAIAVVLPLLDAACQHECVSYTNMVFESGGLFQLHIAQSMTSGSTIKMVCSEVVEQPVIACAKTWAWWPTCAVCQIEPSTNFLYNGTFSLRAPAIQALHFRFCDLKQPVVGLLLRPYTVYTYCHHVESVQMLGP